MSTEKSAKVNIYDLLASLYVVTALVYCLILAVQRLPISLSMIGILLWVLSFMWLAIRAR